MRTISEGAGRVANASPRSGPMVEGVNASESENGTTEVMTADGIAELLRVGRSTVYRWAAGGLIPSLRIGRTVRFRRRSVLEAVESNIDIDKDGMKWLG